MMKKKSTNVRLTEDQAQMASDNIGLVKYVVNRFNNPNNSLCDYEDLVSIGLIKAVLSYDNSKGIKFATFAVPCIANEIKMYFRGEKRRPNIVHLEDEIELNDSTVKLEDTIEDKKANFMEKIALEQEEVEIVNIILNCFDLRTKIMLLYRISGLSQKKIAAIMKISQSYVSRIIKKAIKEIDDMLERGQTYDKVIKITKIDNMYYLELPLIKTDNISEILKDIHVEVRNRNIRNFIVTANEEKIIIKMLADAEYFSMLAKIFSMIYT